VSMLKRLGRLHEWSCVLALNTADTEVSVLGPYSHHLHVACCSRPRTLGSSRLVSAALTQVPPCISPQVLCLLAGVAGQRECSTAAEALSLITDFS
jgi:hypothetical protein